MNKQYKRLSSRDQEIEDIWKQYAGFFEILRGSVIVVVLLVIGAYVFIDQVTDFSMNALTEAIGVIGTAVILDRLYKRRNELERKDELIFQLGSEEPVVAKQAARMLRYKGWLKDGSLRGISLYLANLSGVHLIGADLTGANLAGVDFTGSFLAGANFTDADLSNANLSGANLIGADLTRADLGGVILTGADMDGCILKEASLMFTNLEDVNLHRANLDSARLVSVNLRNTNLKRANLENVRWDEGGLSIEEFHFYSSVLEPTILPDGSKLTHKTDVANLTD